MLVLGISGSLRAVSSNAAALGAAAILARKPVRIVRYEGLATLPPFNPDHDGDDAPTEVNALRRAVGEADALLIFSPEYAHGMPGVLKNLLDWLVSSLEFPGKRLALINTSPRAHHAQDQLVEVLSTMNAHLVPTACVTLPLIGRSLDAASIAADATLASLLREAMETLEQAVGSAPDRSHNRISCPSGQ